MLKENSNVEGRKKKRMFSDKNSRHRDRCSNTLEHPHFDKPHFQSLHTDSALSVSHKKQMLSPA